MMLFILFLLVLSLSCCSLAEKEKLYITQTGAASMQEKQYIEENPDIDITIRRVDDCTPGWVAQQIESGDNITDLYVVRTNHTGYYDLISRGFCNELSSILPLSSRLQGMPQYVLDVISCDGSFYAVPEMIILESSSYLLCNTKHPLWQQYDLKNHHSVTDILDMIDDLYEKNELDQWYLWDEYDDEHMYNLCMVGSVSYMEAIDQINMRDPEYVSLFNRYDKARQTLRERTTPPKRDPLFQTVYLWNLSLLTNQDYELVMVAPFSGQEEMLRLVMEVVVLNPHAPHKEEAIQYLTHMIENYPQMESLFLFPDKAGTPLDTSSEIPVLSQPLSQDFVAKIKANTDKIQIPTDSYLNLFMDEQGISARDRYFSGCMSFEQFIEYMSKRLMMIANEAK